MADQIEPQANQLQPSADDTAFMEQFQRAQELTPPGDNEFLDAFRKAQAEQQLTDQGIDPGQLRGDEWDAMRPQTAGIGAKIGNAIERGGLSAFQKITGLFSGNTYDIPGVNGEPDRTVSRDQLNQETLDKVTTPPQSALYGILSDLTEFGVETAFTGGALRLGGAAVAGATEGTGAAEALGKAGEALSHFSATKIGKTAKVLGFSSGAANFAVTQAVFQDPYATRVSNWLAEAPPDTSGPLRQWIADVAKPLAADKYDNYGLAQAKSLTEGFLTGTLMGMPLAGLGLALGAMKLKIAGAVEKGVLKETEAQALIKEGEAQYAKEIPELQAKMEDPNAPTKIVPLPDGRQQVVLKAQPTAKPKPVDMVSTPEELGVKADQNAGLIAPTLPERLAKSAPRYRDAQVTFQSDLDRAAYISAQSNKSKADQEFVDFVAKHTGMSEAEIRAHGAQLRANMKGLYKPGEDITVPDSGLWKAPEPPPAVPVNEVAPNTVAPNTAVEQPKDIPGPIFNSELEAQNAKAAIDAHHAAADAAVSPVNMDDVKAMQSAVKAMGPNPNLQGMTDLLEKYGINNKYLTDPKDAFEFLKAIVDAKPATSAELRAKPTSWATTIATAKQYGDMTTKDIVNMVQKLRVSTNDAPAVITAARAFLTLQSRQVKKLSLLLEKYPGNGALENHLLDAVQAMHSMHAEFTGANANIGRALNVNKMGTKMLAEALPGATGKAVEAGEGGAAAAGEAAASPMSRMTRQDAIDLAHVIAMNPEQDAEGMMKLMAAPTSRDVAQATGAQKQTLANWLLSARVEGMLSRPLTQIVNIVGNVHRIIQNPLELAWAGAQDIVKGEGTETMHQAWDLAAGEVLNSMEGLRFMYRAFRDAQPILMPSTIAREGLVQNVAPSFSEIAGARGWDAVKTLIRAGVTLSGRTLTATDELFTQIAYRGKVRQDVLADIRSKMEQGIIGNSTEDLKAIAERRMKAAVDDGYRGIYKPAIDSAKDATFKTDLTGFPAAFQTFVQSNPASQFFFPFVRAPANIFDFLHQLTPGLNTFNKHMQGMIAQGGVAAKQAQARAQIGTMLYAVGAYMAASGKITGNGPKDPGLRKTWLQFNQPYSFKNDDGSFTSFKRGDTLFTPLGVMADFWQTAGDMEPTDRASMAATLAACLTANALNRSYMSNVDTLLEAASGGKGDKIQRLLGTSLGSFIPAVSTDIVGQMDPYEKEVNDVWDQLAERIPGMSSTLEPKYNLFGEPVMRPGGFVNGVLNPFWSWKPNGDPYVNQELDKLGRSLPQLPTTAANKQIDLTSRDYYAIDGKSPLRQWYEAMADTGLRKNLTDLIKSPLWKDLTDADSYQEGGQKYSLAAKYIDNARNEAWNNVLQKNEGLSQAIMDEKMVQAGGKVGGRSESVQQIEQLKALGRLSHRNR